MEFLYPVINFLLLALIVFILFRKKIISLFRDRRSRIKQELDEAERVLSESDGEIQIPTTDHSDTGMILASAVAKTEEILRNAHAEEDAILENAEEKINSKRRDALIEYRMALIEHVNESVKRMFNDPQYTSIMHTCEKEFTRRILEKIKLTPGDMKYLKIKGVLYVTLTSARALPQEIIDIFDKKTAELLDQVGGKRSFWVKVDESLIGGLRLRIGDTVYDCTLTGEIYNISHYLESKTLRGDETEDEIVADILSDLKTKELTVNEFQLGRVISVANGICWMDGLADIMYGEVVELEGGVRGMVLDIESDNIGCIIYGDYQSIESGSRVRRIGRIASIYVGDELLGRVVDPLGHAIDGKGYIETGKKRPIEFAAPAIMDRKSVFRPLHTGIKAIDAMVPIGKGQRELIIGDRQTGKTSIAIDTILNQKGKNVICIYVAIGQKDTTVADIRDKLEKNGAMDYTVIINSPASSSSAFQYIAPFAGAAMGEYFMYSGRDVLIVYDDLLKHAVAYRELSLLLNRPSGREAYPGDVFYLHSRLLERAAQLSDELGGGSMTALPIIETQAGDISTYIPTNVISITDGQIFLESDLFNEGQRPAVNVGLSVSRVGGAAQTKLMKQMSGRLRMDLAQYRELANFAQFGSDIDEDTQETLRSGKRMMDALKQRRYAPLADWQQVLMIFAVSEGDFSTLSNLPENFEADLCAAFETNHPDLVTLLQTGKKLESDQRELLRNAVNDFIQSQAA